MDLNVIRLCDRRYAPRCLCIWNPDHPPQARSSRGPGCPGNLPASCSLSRVDSGHRRVLSQKMAILRSRPAALKKTARLDPGCRFGLTCAAHQKKWCIALSEGVKDEQR